MKSTQLLALGLNGISQFRTEVNRDSVKCWKLLLGVYFPWTWIHWPITNSQQSQNVENSGTCLIIRIFCFNMVCTSKYWRFRFQDLYYSVESGIWEKTSLLLSAKCILRVPLRNGNRGRNWQPNWNKLNSKSSLV